MPLACDSDGWWCPHGESLLRTNDGRRKVSKCWSTNAVEDTACLQRARVARVTKSVAPCEGRVHAVGVHDVLVDCLSCVVRFGCRCDWAAWCVNA